MLLTTINSCALCWLSYERAANCLGQQTPAH